MAQTYDYLARMPEQTGKRLCEMALQDMRSLNKEIAWLIEREYDRRQQPTTAYTVYDGKATEVGLIATLAALPGPTDDSQCPICLKAIPGNKGNAICDGCKDTSLGRHLCYEPHHTL